MKLESYLGKIKLGNLSDTLVGTAICFKAVISVLSKNGVRIKRRNVLKNGLIIRGSYKPPLLIYKYTPLASKAVIASFSSASILPTSSGDSTTVNPLLFPILLTTLQGIP